MFVAPNASRIAGTVVGVEPEPNGRGSVWRIAVDRAIDVGNLPNFVRAHVGKIIPVHVQPRLKETVAEADTLEAQIAYRGDERGGGFVVVGNDVRKLAEGEASGGERTTFEPHS